MLVPTLLVVEELDAVEDIGLGIRDRVVGPSPNALLLQARKERFDRRVVACGAATAHATHEVLLIAEPNPIIADVLGALVEMDIHRMIWSPAPD